MYDERKDVRLARANRPIGRILGKGDISPWVYAPASLVNELAAKYPERYLKVLEGWRNAMWNQDFFHVEVANSKVIVHLACASVVDGKPSVIEIVGSVDGDYIRIEKVLDEPTYADWKAIKKEARKYYDGRA